jgi:hypothetical protein
MKQYKSKESSAITPREMLLLRSHLMAKNDGFHFMIYTLCLLLTRLFMRNDDAESFHFSCFEEKYFIVCHKCSFNEVSLLTCVVKINNDRVKSIGVWVQGKCDKEEVMLLLHTDDDVPELDGVRHLLAHIGTSGLTSGCLFPGKSWWKKKTPENQKPISYKEFKTILQDICARVLKRPGPFGCHTFRRTAYLFATWYGADILQKMQAARHKSFDNAERYEKDSLTTIAILKDTAP